MIDSEKMSEKYYQDKEYSDLYRYILDFEQPKEDTFKTVLQLCHGEQQPLERSKKELDAYLQDKEIRGTLTPWFNKWKKWFLDKNRFKDHELIDQPVAFIFFVMADEPDPLRSIEKLRQKMRSLYQLGIYADGAPQNVLEFVFVLNH